MDDRLEEVETALAVLEADIAELEGVTSDRLHRRIGKALQVLRKKPLED